jgi:hypothetical protein
MSYFITRRNFIRVAKKAQLSQAQLLGSVYKSQIYFLNKLEIELILAVKQVLDDINKGVTTLTKSGLFQDTFTYVNEHTHYSSYHLDKNCESLSSNFKDIQIPPEIKYKAGEEEVDYERVNEFRDWMKLQDVMNLYLNDKERFYDRMQIKFKLENRLFDIEIPSTGIQEISSLSVSELEKKIDDLIFFSLEYCYATDERSKILMGENLRLQTYWATSEKYKLMKIIPNNTGYNDETVRKVLLDYHNIIKAPIINSLIDFWIISLNEGLDFEKNIMEQLEFKPCRRCALNLTS